MDKRLLTIGLFGTCGDSIWRNTFIEKYDELNINYFNPQLPIGTWREECAEIEAEHFANDKIILFPITSETYGLGSLSKVGFGMLNAIKLDDRRNFVVLIDKTLNPNLTDESLRKESLKARALAKQHLSKINLCNIYIVQTLEEMLEVSIVLYNAEKTKFSIEKFSMTKK